jgi:hypothetical protein
MLLVLDWESRLVSLFDIRGVRLPDPACGVLPAQSRHHTSPVITGVSASELPTATYM